MLLLPFLYLLPRQSVYQRSQGIRELPESLLALAPYLSGHQICCGLVAHYHDRGSFLIYIQYIKGGDLRVGYGALVQLIT